MSGLVMSLQPCNSVVRAICIYIRRILVREPGVSILWDICPHLKVYTVVPLVWNLLRLALCSLPVDITFSCFVTCASSYSTFDARHCVCLQPCWIL